MARKVLSYTQLGQRIASLVQSQEEVARILNLTQQSVSGKLRGEIAISLEDLQRLAKHHDVPLSYFFLQREVPSSLLTAWERVLDGPVELQQALSLSSKLPREFSIQLWMVVRAMAETLEEIAPTDPSGRAADPL